MSGEPLLRVTGVGRRVEGNDLPILQGISFDLWPEEILTLVGPSGAGKSSLLVLLNRLEEWQEGDVRLQGISTRELEPWALRRQVGLLFQVPVLLPGSVADNLAYGLRLAGIAPSPTEAAEELAAMGLEADFRERDVAGLSGGERQRVALARTLLLRPRVLLLDEPTSALDPESRRAVEGRVDRFRRETGGAVLWVTHDLAQARRLGDHSALLQDGRLYGPVATGAFFAGVLPQAEAFLHDAPQDEAKGGDTP